MSTVRRPRASARKTSADTAPAFTNVDKVFFPAAQFTKGDVIKYYLDVAPVLLPHFRDRPVTLIRFPDGVHGEKFYEKNAPRFAPDWVATTPVPRTEGGVINYILINDARTLAWCANLAAIELHPFLHRAAAIDTPTHLAFDLDPGEGANLLTCIEVALIIRRDLARLQLEAWPKVSGSKGVQLYVPLNTRVTYATAKPFAKALAERLRDAHPDLIVSDMSKALRHKKVLIDWSQNDEKKTTAGVYTLRAKRDEPFVSLPVTWDELRRTAKSGDLDALYFSPADALKRIARRGDLFAPVLELKQTLPPASTSASSPRSSSRRSRPAASAAREKNPLARYAAKRDFTRTAEPAPESSAHSAPDAHRFVIQKHAASHLHYDFRLEMEGTLKSWAVPKGVPYELGVKRSAFQVEDHPLSYIDFEGTIPQGQYGGGTVMVWDIGTYELIGGNYGKGDLKLLLSGQKLKGEWHMFRIKSPEDKPVWLIQKAAPPMRPLSARREDQSVLTGRTMARIAQDNDAQWQSNRRHDSAARPASPPRRTAASSRPAPPPASRFPAPRLVAPMRARAVAALPEGEDWTYEIAWGGRRAFALKYGKTTRLLADRRHDLTADFPSVAADLASLPADTALLDGEIVALDASGRPSAPAPSGDTAPPAAIVYYAFDLLQLDGEDLRRQPLVERQARLAALIRDTGLRLSAGLPGALPDIVAEVQRLGLPGLIAKRRSSFYQAGDRGAWLQPELTAPKTPKRRTRSRSTARPRR